MNNSSGFVKTTKHLIAASGLNWQEKPEEFLEYSDWMGSPIQGYPVTLDRFKSLLLEQVNRLGGENKP